MQTAVKQQGLLSNNQLGILTRVQSVEMQAFLNIIINKIQKNNLKTTCYNVKKAFDSIYHIY